MCVFVYVISHHLIDKNSRDKSLERIFQDGYLLNF